MRRSPYLRASAGEHPECWRDLIVIDEATGKEVLDVIEVDCSLRRLTRLVRGPNGKLVQANFGAEREELHGSFGLYYRDPAA